MPFRPIRTTVKQEAKAAKIRKQVLEKNPLAKLIKKLKETKKG